MRSKMLLNHGDRIYLVEWDEHDCPYVSNPSTKLDIDFDALPREIQERIDRLTEQR